NPSLGEFPGGKGQRSNVARRKERGGDKKFLHPFAKSFWRSSFPPLDDDATVLRPALRPGTDARWLTRGMRRG
ncbi:hypothetical protein DAX92_26640, partial [Salmonella enterica subsp. enterica]